MIQNEQEKQHCYFFNLSNNGKIKYDDALQIIDILNESIDVAELNLDGGNEQYFAFIKILSDVENGTPFSIGEGYTILIDEVNISIWLVRKDITIPQLIISTSYLRHEKPRIDYASFKYKRMLIGGLSFPIYFCAMEPCDSCGCLMDCDRGGYRI